MPPQDILNDQAILEAALEGLKLQRQRLDAQIAEVEARLGRRTLGKTAASAVPKAKPAPKKSRISAAARKRMSEGAKRRWALAKKATKTAAPKKRTSKATKKAANKSAAKK